MFLYYRSQRLLYIICVKCLAPFINPVLSLSMVLYSPPLFLLFSCITCKQRSIILNILHHVIYVYWKQTSQRHQHSALGPRVTSLLFRHSIVHHCPRLMLTKECCPSVHQYVPVSALVAYRTPCQKPSVCADTHSPCKHRLSVHHSLMKKLGRFTTHYLPLLKLNCLPVSTQSSSSFVTHVSFKIVLHNFCY